MPKPDFVHFETLKESARARVYDGYLSFLSSPPLETSQSTVAHRLFAHDDFYWLEVKDVVLDDPFRLHLKPQESCLWIGLPLLGDCSIQLKEAMLISSGSSACFASHRKDLKIELRPGKNWLLLFGFRETRWKALMEEFPVLDPLKEMKDGNGEDWVLGEALISTRLRNVLESLRRMVFRTFSTPIQMAAWNLRLLNYILGERKPDEVAITESDDVSHYHRAVKYIRENYQEDINLEKVADAVHLSVRNLTRCFEDRAYTVNGYILHLRLTKARELLAFSEMTITDIAYELHFNTLRHFRKMFQLKFKKSPKAYRTEMKPQVLGLDKSRFRR